MELTGKIEDSSDVVACYTFLARLLYKQALNTRLDAHTKKCCQIKGDEVDKIAEHLALEQVDATTVAFNDAVAKLKPEIEKLQAEKDKLDQIALATTAVLDILTITEEFIALAAAFAP